MRRCDCESISRLKATDWMSEHEENAYALEG